MVATSYAMDAVVAHRGVLCLCMRPCMHACMRVRACVCACVCDSLLNLNTQT